MKITTRSLLAAATMAVATIARAAEDDSRQIAFGPPAAWAVASEPLAVPEDASGLAFVRAQDTVVHLDDEGQQTFVAQRLTLLHPQSLQLGNVAIAWNPAAGAPTVHALKIHRGTEVIDVLAQSKFEILRREDQLEAAMLDGLLTAILRVPDLRVGDELELAWTIPSQDPTLRETNASLLALTGQTLPGRYHLGLVWEPDATPRIAMTDDFPGTVTRADHRVDVRTDNPPQLVKPKDAPPRYGWQRIIEFSDFASWNAVSSRFAGLFTRAAQLPSDSPIKAEAARIAAANLDPAARAQAALELVQQQVRYVYVGLNGGNFQPAPADTTWGRRYGDCKGKTVLLLALLNELGIAAEPVLVSNAQIDDGIDAHLPNPGLFDHVVVRATAGGKRLWLDGTLPAVATASTVPDFPYRWVLPLTAKGSALEPLPWKPATRPLDLNLYEIDAREGFDAPARIVSTSITRGPDALTQHMQFSSVTPDQMLQAFRSNLTGSSTWDTVESVRYHFDKAERAAVLEIIGTGPVDWDDDGNNRRSLSLPGGGFSPPGRRQRAPDQDQTAPFYDAPNYSCHVTTVRLPSDTKPSDWSFNSTFDTLLYDHLYYRAFEQRGGTIRMIRGSRTQKPEIDPATAQRDNGRLARFDNSMAWIYYAPGANNRPPDTQQSVPATYEGDWLDAASACLPKDMRG